MTLSSRKFYKSVLAVLGVIVGTIIAFKLWEAYIAKEYFGKEEAAKLAAIVQTCNPQTNYYPTIPLDPMARCYIDNVFTKDDLVMFGSSELDASAYKSVPYLFFNQKKPQLIAFGYAGHQSFSIFSQLLYYYNGLKNKKIIVNVSPLWFDDRYQDGTSMPIFLEMNPEDNIKCIVKNRNIPRKFKQYYYRYIEEKKDEVNPITPVINYAISQSRFDSRIVSGSFYYMLFSLETSVQSCLRALYSNRYDNLIKKEINDIENTRKGGFSGAKQTTDWNILIKYAQNKAVRESTNNKFGIRNDIFDSQFKNAKLPITAKVPGLDSQELRDFKMCLELLKTSGADVYFIYLPLNPKAYANVAEFEPLRRIIKTEIIAYGYDCFDLTDMAAEPGILQDIMHPGEAGWYKVDEAIYNKFKLGAK